MLNRINDTIAAIATPRAAGGISVIRISGEQAFEIAGRVFRTSGGELLKDSPGYRAYYGRVHDGGEDIDEAVCLVFLAPKSYTGEHVAEISCHGGIFVTERVLGAVLANGARLAEPGEFTKRAFLNGKIDLTQAEAVAGIISAGGKRAAQMALDMRDGRISREIGDMKNRLLNSAAHLAAWADFPEEDIEEVSGERLVIELEEAKAGCERLISGFNTGRILREGVETVIAGKPNVGKSTLMNLLAGADRSIVTPVAGTTRDIVEESVRLGDIVLRLSDTAGLRDTTDEVEAIGVERAEKKLDSAELVLAVFDAGEPLDESDKRLIKRVKNRKAIAVINKTDLPAKIDTQYIEKDIKHTVYISARDNNAIDVLKSEVEKVVLTPDSADMEFYLGTERQRECVKQALSGLGEAIASIDRGMTLDAVTVSLESAIDALLELTGEKVTDAVADSVFHQFCVGK